MFDITTITNTAAATTNTIEDAIKIITYFENVMWDRSLSSDMNYEERSDINGFLMNLKSTIKGMAEGKSAFLLSVYTDALSKTIADPTFKETAEKFAAILTNEEQQKAMMLGSILESIDKYFRDYEE